LFGFIASASAIVCVGAVPIFVDVDPLTCQISPAAIEAAITPRTRAIIVVHFSGYMADMEAIMEIANKHGVFVIEDCAHAHGASWRNKRAGSRGTFGSFSFQQSKALSSGEGGIVITSDEQMYEKTQLIRNIGRRTGQRIYSHEPAIGG
jgi:dTDP-4-amino-4,6-dideoxygalactose transaminase